MVMPGDMGDAAFATMPGAVTRGNRGSTRDVVIAGIARAVSGNSSLPVGAGGARDLYMDANQILEAIRMIVREELNNRGSSF